MITPVVMPQMGLEVTEGVVGAIHVAPGARVSDGQPLVDMETDKAVTEVVAPRDGVVRSVEIEVGDTVALGATLVVLADEDAEAAGDEVSRAEADDGASPPTASERAGAEADGGASPPTASERAGAEADGGASPPTASERAGAEADGGASSPSADDHAVSSAKGAGAGREAAGGRLRAAPVARRAAERLGVDLAAVEGTGPRGRITLGDVERAAAAAPAPAEPALEPLSATRRAIARRMTESARIPQFALEREIDATWLLAEKQRLAGPARIGVTDLLVQALAEMVSRHPDLARSYEDAGDGPALRRRAGVDVGLAVATPRGLLVPALRSAHTRSLAQLAQERVRLVEAARGGRLGAADMGGAALTLSNLAGFGVDRFTAMLNPGESAILAVGRTVERVVPRGRGMAVVPTLSLTLTVDHRAADGAAGGAALSDLADLLEGAMTWRP